MKGAQRLWAVVPEDGYAGVVAADWDHYASLDYMSLNSKQLSGLWNPPQLEFAIHRALDKTPDAACLYFPGVFCFRRSMIEALFSASMIGLELLPATLDGEDWVVLNCLRSTDGIDYRNTELQTIDDSPGLPPRILDVRWINIVDSEAYVLEIFCLRPAPLTRLLCTDVFAQRARTLGLRGLDFKHIGYIVPDTSQAIPKPPTPPAPHPKPSKRKPPKLTSGPLPDAELTEIAEVGAAWRQRLQLVPEASPQSILQRITDEMYRLRSVFWTISAEERIDASLGLSAIYGELLRSACGWSWAELRESRSKRWIAVLAPSGMHALALLPYVQQQIQSGAPTVTLLFNMIVAGNLPPAEPGQPVLIG